MTEVHPFAALAGAWWGRGEGGYPTIERFTYDEELVIEVVPGRPVAHWRSRTRDATTGEVRHAESGFLRSTPEGVELVLAHSFGIVEAATGTLEATAAGVTVLELASDAMHATPSAKQVDRVRRHVTVHDDTLTYVVGMAAVGVAMTGHLSATLTRDPAMTPVSRRPPVRSVQEVIDEDRTE